MLRRTPEGLPTLPELAVPGCRRADAFSGPRGKRVIWPGASGAGGDAEAVVLEALSKLALPDESIRLAARSYFQSVPAFWIEAKRSTLGSSTAMSTARHFGCGSASACDGR